MLRKERRRAWRRERYVNWSEQSKHDTSAVKLDIDLRGSQYLHAAVGAFVAAGIVFGAYFIRSQQAGLYAATAAVAIMIVLIALIAHRVHGRDFLAPLYLILLVFFFYSVVRGFYLVADPAAAQLHIRRPVIDALASAQLTSLLGLGSFAVGYLALRTRPKAAAGRTPMSTLSLGSALALLSFAVVGWIARFVAIREGSYTKLSFGTTVSGSSVAATLGFLAFFACAVTVIAAHVSSRRVAMRIAVALSAGEIIFAVMVGYKSNLILLTLVWLVARHYTGRTIRVSTIAILLLVFIFVIIPVVQMDRELQEHLAAQPTSRAVRTALAKTPSAWWHHRAEVINGVYSLDTLMNRTMSVEDVALAERYKDEFGGNQFGKEYLLAIPSALVPTPIWPSKPRLQLAEKFTAVATRIAGPQSAVAPSVTADFYLNFGLFGVAAGWALIGAFLRFAYDRLIANRQRGIERLVLYTVALAAILPALESTVGAVEVAVIQQVGLAWFGLLVVRRMTRHG
jgi:hypothetical protein